MMKPSAKVNVRRFFILLVATSSLATQATVSDQLSVSARLWSLFSYQVTSGSTHRTGFDLYRGHIKGEYKLPAQWRVQSTIEHVTTPTPLTSVFEAFIEKSAVFFDNDQFRFGLQPTPYIERMNRKTNTRWLGKVLIDHVGLLASRSGGVAYSKTRGDWFEFAFLLHNGVEGRSQAGNTDSGLAIAELFTVYPFSQKFGFTLSYDLRYPAKTSTSTTGKHSIIMFAVHSQMHFFDWNIEYLINTLEGSATEIGFGTTLNLQPLGDRYSLYVRFFSGNQGFQNNQLAAKSIFTVGPSMHISKAGAIKTALLYEHTRSNVAGISETTMTWNWAADI